MELTYFIIGLFFLLIIQVMPAIKDSKLTKILMAVPLINAVADVTTNYFPDGYFTIGAFRTLILLILILLLSGNIKYRRTAIFIFIFLFYLVFLISLSSNSSHSFNEFLKVAISLLMFPIGYHLLNNKNLIKKLNTYLFLGVGVIILQIVISQIFKLGVSEYLEDSLYLGGGLVQITYTLALFVIMSPIIIPLIKNKNEKYLYLIFILLSTTVTLLILRRISIAAILVGYVVYLILSDHKFRVLKYGLLTVLLLSVTFPIYGNLFKDRLQSRVETVPPMMEAARLLETFLVINEINENSLSQALFGKDLFSSNTYFKKKQNYFLILGRDRQLHVDYNIILHGAGIIGLFLYILIYLNLFMEGLKKRKSHTYLHREIKAVFWSIYTVTLIMSLSGSISSIGFRSDAFLYMGALLGILNKKM